MKPFLADVLALEGEDANAIRQGVRVVLVTGWGYSMTFDLTRDEIWFLKALRTAGERGRIVSAPTSRAGLAHLVEVQYVTEYPQSERRTLYTITDRGRQALANAQSLTDKAS